MSNQTWSGIVSDSLQTLWDGFVGFIPNLIGAIVVFLIGLVVAVVLGKLVTRIVQILRIDPILEKTGFKRSLEKANLKLDSGKFLGELVKWFFIVAFLMAATEILNLPQITDFLKRIFFYLPQLVVAVLILLAGILIANFLQRLVRASVEAAELRGAGILAGVAKWAILVFAALAALMQLGIAPVMIQTLFTGVIGALALGFGLALGLGGKETAAEILEKIKRNISS